MNSRDWFMYRVVLDCALFFSCENDQKAFYKIMKDCWPYWIKEESSWSFRKQSFQLDTNIDEPLQIKSDYHSVNYAKNNLDTWKYTNSTEVFMNYTYSRLG